MSDERLSQLLRFKVAERPSKEFWDRFDASMGRKCLQELCAKPRLIRRIRESLVFLMRGIPFLSMVTAGVAFFFLNFSSSLPLEHGNAPMVMTLRTNTSPKEYVRDIVKTPQSRKFPIADVMKSDIRPARYICDSIAHTSISRQAIGSTVAAVPICF
jgi:hypothetical protein